MTTTDDMRAVTTHQTTEHPPSLGESSPFTTAIGSNNVVSTAQASPSLSSSAQADSLSTVSFGPCGQIVYTQSLENCSPKLFICKDPLVDIENIVVESVRLDSSFKSMDLTTYAQGVVACNRLTCHDVLYYVLEVYSRSVCLHANGTDHAISVSISYTYGPATYQLAARDLLSYGAEGFHSNFCDGVKTIWWNGESQPTNIDTFICEVTTESQDDEEATEVTFACEDESTALGDNRLLGNENCGAIFAVSSPSLYAMNAIASFRSVRNTDVVGGHLNVRQDGFDDSDNFLSIISNVLEILVSIGNETANLTPPDDFIVIDFTVDITVSTDKVFCAFLVNESAGIWSTNGCETIFSNDTVVRCRANHLTSFAVLLSAKPPTGIHAKVQSILSQTLGGLSIACLVLAVVLYCVTGTWKLLKIQIHMNLAVSTALGQLLFLTMAEDTRYPVLCKCVAVTLQYLFTAALAWTMIEGVYLYRTTAIGFKPLHIGYLSMVAWGGALVVVGVSFGVLYDGYGSTNFCWLRHQDNTIYVFVGCVFATVLFNAVMLWFVMKSFMSLKANSQKDNVNKLKATARALLILLPVLGLTWVAGTITSISKSDDIIFFQYLFIIAFSLQGVCILIFHCLHVPDVKSALQLKYRRRVKDSTWVSNSKTASSTATSTM
ncbi:adhesion G protein-coupled receptor L4-like [Diadema setosum]|uniref:adhesion G protein-coupled receptor L4-like n=1 Tax=Diadema setosum TaxID=31175 RepID=UPI003B3A45FE